jgi:hypothetical protein
LSYSFVHDDATLFVSVHFVALFEHVEVADSLAHAGEILRRGQILEQFAHHVERRRRAVHERTDVLGALFVGGEDFVDSSRRVRYLLTVARKEVVEVTVP